MSWEVKRGERVGLVGVNGAGKTTQLQIIIGALVPDAGEIIRAKANMKIAYLNQEFDISPTRTVREEFMSAFADQMAVAARQEEIQQGLEQCGEDMERMSKLLGEGWGVCVGGQGVDKGFCCRLFLVEGVGVCGSHCIPFCPQNHTRACVSAHS